MPLLRGAIPSSRHRLASAEPHKVSGVVPPRFIMIPKQLSMWGNDTYGDCVTAEEAFAKACHNLEIFIPEVDAIQWARKNGFLDGADLTSVMDQMRSHGFIQGASMYDDGIPTSVDWTNPTVLHSAISRGPVKIGVAANQLETVCQAYTNFPANGWIASGFQRDTDEDHCVSLCGYGSVEWLATQLRATISPHIKWTTPAYAMFTWGSIGIIDAASMVAITHEAWLRTPTTIIK